MLLPATESLAIVPPNTEVRITNGGQTNTVHTFTSLLYPTGATKMPFDQPEAFRGSRSVNSWTRASMSSCASCIHSCLPRRSWMTRRRWLCPPAGPAYDLGENITLISYGGISVPTTSDLAARLLRAFFLITNPANYQDHNPVTNPTGTWLFPCPAHRLSRLNRRSMASR